MYAVIFSSHNEESLLKARRRLKEIGNKCSQLGVYNENPAFRAYISRGFYMYFSTMIEQFKVRPPHDEALMIRYRYLLDITITRDESRDTPDEEVD